MTQTIPPMPSQAPAGRPMAPPPEFALLRTDAPISRVAYPDGTVVWLLTTYDDVRAVLGDPRFSSETLRPGFPIYGLPGRNTPEFGRSIIRRDEPDHLRLRRLVTREFMPKRIASHEAEVRRIVTDHLDALDAAGPPGDFVSGFALSVPSTVISLLLGVPQADHEIFQDATQRLTSRHDSGEKVAEALRDLNGYFLDLAEQKAKDPQDDVLSRLVAAEADGQLTRDEVASYGTLLVSAGHDTTAGTLALSILTLVQAPDQLARLANDESLWDTAVEELLRYHSIVRGGPRRLALEDVRLGDHLIRAGEGVMVSLWSANHDQGHFTGAEGIDVQRGDAASHVAFGFGAHQCLGQSLARLEMRIGLPEVFRRFPGLSSAVPTSELRFRTDTTNFGLHSLPMTW